MEADTFPKCLLHNYERWGSSKVALRSKEHGFWREYNWEECYHQVKEISLGLVSLGLQPGDKVTIAGDNAPEWHFAQLAAMAANAAVVASPPDSLASELKFLIEHSDSTFVVAADQEQVDKVLDVKEELPKVKKVIYWDTVGMRGYDDPVLANIEEVKEIGREYEQTHPGSFEENIAAGNAGDLLAIIYTSGTTGVPKGVMVSHRASLNTARSLLALFRWPKMCDFVTSQPPTTVMHYSVGTVLNLVDGHVLDFPETADTLLQDQREIGGTIIGFVPRQWDNIISQIQIRVNDAGFLKRFFYGLVLPIGYKRVDFRLQRKEPPPFWRALNAFADFTVFEPVRDKLGLSKAEVPVTGGTLSSAEGFRLLHGLGIKVRNWYMGTEPGSVAMATDDTTSLRSVGRPVPGIEVRISEGGETLLRGPNVFFDGYYKDPELSEKMRSGEWLRTGDAGHVSEDGEFFVIDRLSNLTELATGAKYSPQHIESELRFSPYINEALVIGGKERDYLAAIVNINFDTVGKWAERQKTRYTTFVDLSQKPEVAELVRKDISRVNKILPESSRIKKYVLLHKEFDPDEGEITRSRKVRRDFLDQKYAQLIGAIYEDKEEVPVEATVKYRDGRVATVSTNLNIRSVIGGED